MASKILLLILIHLLEEAVLALQNKFGKEYFFSN